MILHAKLYYKIAETVESIKKINDRRQQTSLHIEIINCIDFDI